MNLIQKHLLKLLFLITFSLILSSCQIEENKPFSIIKDDQGIEIFENGTPVLFYQSAIQSFNGEYPTNNFIHPLYDLNGDTLTQSFPEDHLYHRGIFWAWHRINHHDSTISNSWISDNFITKINDLKTESNQSEVLIFVNASWISNKFSKDPYLNENTIIKIHKIKDSLRIIDFEINLEALVNGISIAGADNEKGYGGFCLRLITPDSLKFTSEDGQIIPQYLQSEKSSWMDFSANFGTDASISGMTLLCHPSNLGYPPNWILRQKRSMQNVVFPGQQLMEFKKNIVITLKYRLVIHNGKAVSTDIAEWFKEYSEK